MEPDSAFPLVAADLLAALVTATSERLDANHEWCEVFGDGDLWSRLPDEDARFAEEYVTECARGAPVTHQVFLVERPGADAPTPVLLHFLPVRLPDGQPGRFPVSVTGEILREPASWAAEQTRRRRMEMLGRMSMGIAHDFNNLLTTVLGHAELLRSDLAGLDAGPVPRSHLGALEQAARDGAALVRKIQQYIRNEKEEHVEPVELHAIAAEVITLTRPYWHNEPRRRGIAIDLEEDLRPVPAIPGAPTELREVLVNLILNAVQAMPAGGTLSVRTGRRTGYGVVVEIGDTGVGMSETVRRRIFEPLFTTKGSGGSGMGLTMSQGIVHEHNGQIEVDSEPGRGTAFRLVFPFGDEHDAPTADAGASPTAAGEAGRPAGLRILVVDDEPMVRTVTTKLLRLRGHTVTDVDGGPAALRALDAAAADGGPYDLVVTDLSMPEMSGRELATAIHEQRPGFPVVLLTGDTDAVIDGQEVSAVVKKPFQLDDLDAVVREAAGSVAAG